MKEYTYSETEYFVLQHLYYAMGKNRMKWYEFKELMVPSLEREIQNIIHEFVIIPFNRDDKYNSHDIDTIIRKIKEKFEIFGHYEGYSVINEYIKQDMSIIAGGK